MRRVDWYFDFISPFAYLQTFRFKDLPADLEVVPQPLLFAGLLNHWGQKGPAEVASKRTYSYSYLVWLARRLGVPYRLPPSHPFNPLRALRLALALDCKRDAVFEIFRCIWQEGWLPDDPEGWHRIAEALGVADADVRIAAPEVKAALRANGEAAIAAGVFGVPTFVLDGHLFWGLDGTDFFLDALADPGLLDEPEMRRVRTLRASAERVAG